MKVFTAKPTLEGAGVRLRRALGYDEVPMFDPFLLLDHFGSPNPDDYMAGFPWHPHRGIETVTYMMNGVVEHGDSMGNSGVIGAGDVQWMTAGGGIIHQEMPRRAPDFLMGFQLWVNLPSTDKMIEPRYRGVLGNTIPVVRPKDGVEARVIGGDYEGVKGPVQDLVVEVDFLDVTLRPGTVLEHSFKDGHNAFCYVFEGRAKVMGAGIPDVGPGTAVLFGRAGTVAFEASEITRFLLVSGIPVGEPVAWHGPIVMNTWEEIETAFREYEEGTFIK